MRAISDKVAFLIAQKLLFWQTTMRCLHATIGCSQAAMDGSHAAAGISHAAKGCSHTAVGAGDGHGVPRELLEVIDQPLVTCVEQADTSDGMLSQRRLLFSTQPTVNLVN